MQFELTEALIDAILFSMEDQDGEFLVDTQDGVVIGLGELSDSPLAGDPEETNEDEDRYIKLPEWGSSDGFRLMERFAAGLRNPILRTKLSSALNRGKGVFRAFKDILSQSPEAEKLWFAHKEREMKRQILHWYNSLREEWGMVRIGGEPEDTGDLVLEDFRFRESKTGDMAAAGELHRLCAAEYRNHAAENGIKGLDLEEEIPWAFPASGPGKETAQEPAVGFVAETGGGEFAGYISAILKSPALHIIALEVRPEYRGLGVGEALVSRILEKAAAELPGQKPISRLTIDLPAGTEGFSRVLLRASFKPYAIRYCVTLPMS